MARKLKTKICNRNLSEKVKIKNKTIKGLLTKSKVKLITLRTQQIIINSLGVAQILLNSYRNMNSIKVRPFLKE